jgi:hypothetical protein
MRQSSSSLREDEIELARSTHDKDTMYGLCIQFWLQNMKGRDCSVDLDIDGTVYESGF